MNISAQQVKELRQATGAGMMECKNALQENAGDMQQAIVWLRERGMARAAKKAGRTAAEGVVEFLIATDGTQAAMVELNCETDFADKNEDFRGFARSLAQCALTNKTQSAEALSRAKIGSTTVSEQLLQLIAKIGENMTVRRVAYVHEPKGRIFGYSHMGGKIGTLVTFKGNVTHPKMADVGADLAMHVAAASPRFLTRDQVVATELEQEKAIIRKRLLDEGKPENIVEKALLGQVNKYYQEICLLDQAFVKEPKLSVTSYIKQSGADVTLARYDRFQLGEGIEVTKTDFAAEVASQIK